MVGSATSPQKLSPDERKFLADTFQVALASIIMRYDGALAESAPGVAHLAAEQARCALIEYRRLTNGVQP